MKMVVMAALILGGISVAKADDFSGSQEYLRNSPGAPSKHTGEQSNPNDLSNSQKHLRESGGSQRPVYRSCQEAPFGSQFWQECRQVSPR